VLVVYTLIILANRAAHQNPAAARRAA